MRILMQKRMLYQLNRWEFPLAINTKYYLKGILNAAALWGFRGRKMVERGRYILEGRPILRDVSFAAIQQQILVRLIS